MRGIDIPIEDLRSALEIKFPDCSVYGRIFRIKYNDKVIPASLINNDYKDVLQNDNKYGVIFFDVEPERVQKAGLMTADVNICFMLNLLKIYPAESRPTELAHLEVENVIRQSSFRQQSLITGVTAFKQFSVESIDDMNPFYIFSFKTKLNYNLLNC